MHAEKAIHGLFPLGSAGGKAKVFHGRRIASCDASRDAALLHAEKASHGLFPLGAAGGKAKVFHGRRIASCDAGFRNAGANAIRDDRGPPPMTCRAVHFSGRSDTARTT
jgi:hypothetical protein